MKSIAPPENSINYLILLFKFNYMGLELDLENPSKFYFFCQLELSIVDSLVITVGMTTLTNRINQKSKSMI